MLKTIDESEITKIGRKVTKIDCGYVDHTNTKCCMCESKETRILPNNRPCWFKYKVDKDRKIDSNRSWNEKSYMRKTI